MDKQNAIKLLDATFNADFDANRYIEFIKELFNNFAINQKSWSVWKEYFDYIESYQLLGSYRDNSKKIIDVLVVKLRRTSSRDRARTMQRNFVAKYLGNAEKDGALIAFYGDDPQDWRFSFVKMEYNLVKDEYGKVTVAKELTPAKRYSFLVGVNEPNHTCRSQFLNLIMEEDINPSLSDIEQAFSIDNVTKEFFTKYKELFLELEESLQKVINKDNFVKKEFEEKNISTVDFAKKLLGQIVFIYFLQKKGWLGVEVNGKWSTGPKDFMRRLYGDKNKGIAPLVPYDNFFNDILEPLFYDALATDRSADDHYYRLFKCKIPFLNGGLFEPINEYNWSGTDILLDNSIFDNILSTFDRFNFTVKEDEPLEKEVAVDPEMLGKVFENLLEVKDRKSKGAFYTPREIVHYMCQQSLINYLETNTSIPRKDVEKFIQLGDFALDQIIKEQEQIKKYGKSYDIKEKYTLPKSIKDNYKEIDRLLKDIKIVDPAVGSGAFLVGMMNEIVKARSILSIFFKEERKNYDLKREIIENCLYGVDIEPSAVEITKLRFWLSLIVDELDMKNIKPLPNLDHKIMCGNSLLEEFEGVKLFDDRLLGEVKKDYSFEIKQIDEKIALLYKEKGDIVRGKKNGSSLKDIEKEIKKLERKKEDLISAPKTNGRNLTLDEATQNRIKESQKKLNEYRALQKQLINEQNRKIKKQLREDIDRIEWELIEETLKEQGNEEAMQKLEQYKKNKAKPFFLWKLYFSEVFQRENPGFDVVIANPPYVVMKSLNSEVKEYFEKNYRSALYQINLYLLFVEKGLTLLREKGTLSYIIPNTWLINKTVAGFRKYLIEKFKIESIVDLTKKEVFEATVLPIVLIVKNELPNEENNILIRTFVGNYIKDISKIRIKDINKENNFLINYQINKKINPIINKIENNSSRLENISKISFGVKFYQVNKGEPKQTNEIVKRHVFTHDRRINDFCKIILEGKDISRYLLKVREKYIEYGPWLAEPRSPDLFQGERILLRRIVGKEGLIATKINGEFCNNSLLHTIKIYDNLENNTGYVLGLLNSKLIGFYFISKFARDEKTFPEIRIHELKSIPIKIISPQQQKPFIQLVDQILSITKDDDYLKNPDKRAKVKKLENDIDQLVYKLYELTPDEIKIVEGFGEER